MSVSEISTLSKISQLIPTYPRPPPDLLPILSELFFFVPLRTLRNGFIDTPKPEGRGHSVIILIIF